MKRAEMIKKIRADYNEALADNTFCNCEEAAYNAADSRALWCVMNRYGISNTRDLTPEMQNLRRSLRIEAIGA